MIAQCLAAAQKTIPPPSPSNSNANFFIHSMHCYFVLAGDSTLPILYHVERVREGRSFMTRTVQARQRGKCIFTTTCSFMREGSGGERVVEHEWSLPEGAVEALQEKLREEGSSQESDKSELGREMQLSGPFIMKKLGIVNRLSQTPFPKPIRFFPKNQILTPSPATSPKPHKKKTLQWIRSRGTISPSGGREAHLSALAYMSDSWFIATVSRVHNLWRFSQPNSQPPSPTSPSPLHKTNPSSRPAPTKPFSALAKAYLSKEAAIEAAENSAAGLPATPRAGVGMMVSLDHSIYFHRPREVLVDEWLLCENESPWSGEGRGLVTQRIWGKGGRLLATCVQEVFSLCFSYVG